MKNMRLFAFGAAITMLSVSGFVADAAPNDNKPTNAWSTNAVTIFTNPNFSAQIHGQAYTSYFDGTVTTETSKQISQLEDGGHSPWRANPLDVAVYGTQNFAPQAKGGVAQTSETSKEFVGTYQGKKVTYTLTSSTSQSATIVEKGLPYGLTIKLYKPVHHKYWLINQITLNG